MLNYEVKSCRVCTNSVRKVTSRCGGPACSEATPAMLIPLHTSGRPDAPQSLSSYFSSSNSSSNRLLNRKLLAPTLQIVVLPLWPSQISSKMLATRNSLSSVRNLYQKNRRLKSRKSVQVVRRRCRTLKRSFRTISNLKWASVRRLNSKPTQSLPTWKWVKRTVRSRIYWCTPMQTMTMVTTLCWNKGIRISPRDVRERAVLCDLRSKETWQSMSAAVEPTTGVDRGTIPARDRISYMMLWRTKRWQEKRLGQQLLMSKAILRAHLSRCAQSA